MRTPAHFADAIDMRAVFGLLCMCAAAALSGCAGGSGIPAAAGRNSSSVISSDGQNITATGSIVALGAGGFQMQGGQGLGYVNVRTGSSASVNGTLSLGQNVEVSGTELPDYSIDAQTVQTLPTARARGTVVATFNGGFQIEGGRGVGYLNAYTNAYSYISGGAPYVGEAVQIAGDAASGAIDAKYVATWNQAHIAHVTVIVMENFDYEEVMGNAQAPYFNQFAAANALFTNSSGVAHPSEPNYLALFSGSTQGVTSDACPLTFTADNLAAELLAGAYTFDGYAEGWPGAGNPCFAEPANVTSGYLYWRKHAPWADFTGVSLYAYSHAYTSATSLAGSVNFIIPDICNDMHDCGVAAGDRWLSAHVPEIESWDDAHRGLLIVTFDEGEYSATNHIATVMAGPMVNPGTYAQAINHYSVLRLIEDNFGLPYLGQSAYATPISGVIR
jgi:acid phosphatase